MICIGNLQKGKKLLTLCAKIIIVLVIGGKPVERLIQIAFFAIGPVDLSESVGSRQGRHNQLPTVIVTVLLRLIFYAGKLGKIYYEMEFCAERRSQEICFLRLPLNYFCLKLAQRR